MCVRLLAPDDQRPVPCSRAGRMESTPLVRCLAPPRAPQRAVRFMLVTALVAGYATHGPPVATDRGPPARQMMKRVALWRTSGMSPGRALVCGGAGIMA